MTKFLTLLSYNDFEHLAGKVRFWIVRKPCQVSLFEGKPSTVNRGLISVRYYWKTRFPSIMITPRLLIVGVWAPVALVRWRLRARFQRWVGKNRAVYHCHPINLERLGGWLVRWKSWGISQWRNLTAFGVTAIASFTEGLDGNRQRSRILTDEKTGQSQTKRQAV